MSLCTHLREKGAKDPGEGHEAMCSECFMRWLERFDQPSKRLPRLRRLFERRGR